MNDKKYEGLNLNILKSKKSRIISSEEALKDIIPIEWSDEVLEGKEKVIIGDITEK